MSHRNIIFLTDSLLIGGAEKQTINLINHLDASRFAVTLCYFVQVETLPKEIKMEKLAGLFCLQKKWRFDLVALMRLKKIVYEIRPDIVVCVNPYSAFYAHLLRIVFRMQFKLIVVVHSTNMPDRYHDLIVRLLYGPLLNRSDSVVFVCRNQMEYWINNYGIKRFHSTYIHNGIDVNYFSLNISDAEKNQLREKLGIDNQDIVICLCAVMRKEKRHVDLIDAGKILVNKGVPLKILLIGYGPERRNIEEHIRQKQMTENVILTGFKEDVRPFMALADIVTITSSIETFSIVILEAMSLGKPIVASNIGGVSEQIIPGENGLLFPAGNVRALAETLAAIITQKTAKSMGERSKELVSKQFTSERMVEQYEALFESV